MEKQTFTTNFWVSPSKTRKNGEAPIMTTLTLNGERASFSTHKNVLPTEWDSKRQRVKGTNGKARLINEYLDIQQAMCLFHKLPGCLIGHSGCFITRYRSASLKNGNMG